MLALAGPAAAGAPDFDRSATKALLGGAAKPSGGKLTRLPLGPARTGPRASTSEQARDLRALRSASGPRRVLISVSAHEHVDSVAADARELGNDVRVVRSLGVVVVTARSAPELVRRLAGDPRVTAIEPNRIRHASADPADVVDPETGVPFGWGYDAVNASAGLTAVGGASRRLIAVVDTGLDAGHPDFAGLDLRQADTIGGRSDTTDFVGHGTFVTGMIGMQHDNGIGGRGAGGGTPILGIRASLDGSFQVDDLLLAKDLAIRRRARVLNLSLGGESLTETEARALEFAFLSDVLIVAAAGNSAQVGNPIQFPAALVGGRRGRVGIGLSVAATRPDGSHAPFSTFNDFVSVAAPGGAQSGCAHGVFSTIPREENFIWDDPQSCSRFYGNPGDPGRWGYSEGTSFAAPLVSGIAALAWEAEPRLASEQVADVLQRTARQTVGRRWNRRTGHGVVDGGAATALARRYDIRAPSLIARARRTRTGVRITVTGRGDRTTRGREKAGGVRYGIIMRRGGSTRIIAGPSRRRLTRRYRLRRGTVTTYYGIACDANGNCGTRRLGSFRYRRPSRR